MELNTQPLQGPVRPAASVVMLRDGQEGLEVFLLKRHGLSEVLGGVYVFPGGKVDPEDAVLDLPAHLDLPPQTLHAALGEPELDLLEATALHVAALREAFEETGVLYAQGAGARQAALAWDLLRQGRSFDEVLQAMSLRLEASRLQPWSRWITPVIGAVARKRFDTRFFLAAVPEGQQARHDDHEATESVWLTPRKALQQYWEGSIALAPPQILSLAHLSRHASIASALAEARRRLPPTIRPELFEEDGTRVVCYPGDGQHSVRQRALPAPTRLHYRDRRLEPTQGFEAFFAD
ncbi:MAG TPA: NUDIX hydrolase [Ramlibacter sp.]|nr:NUDIX hydrolase [Ramlibacter sp.]